MPTIPTRGQWQSIRDSARVPKGAAKVSVGDVLDKVDKSMKAAKNPKQMEKVLPVLTKALLDIEQYKKGIQKSYGPFVKQVDDKVSKPLREMHMNITKYSGNFKSFRNTIQEIPTVIKDFRSARKARKVADVIKYRNQVLYLMKASMTLCNNCADLDKENAVTWQNVVKYCALAQTHAKGMDKILAKYAKVKAGTEQEAKLRTEYDNAIDEALDTLNKVLAATSPLIK